MLVASSTDTLRRCCRCRGFFTVDQFYRRKNSSDGRHSWCVRCCRSYKSAVGQRRKRQARRKLQAVEIRQAENRDVVLRRYGLTLDDYQQLLDAQRGLCGICRQPETAMRNGRPMNLAVDHCHKTSRIRGLLCLRCNNVLGHAGDRVEVLLAAVRYLQQGE